MTQPNTSRELELQNLLGGEREKYDQLKQLYQTLKEEAGKVTDELKLVHQQLRETRLKNEQMQVTKDNFIKKLEEQLCEKQREISKLSEEVRSCDPRKIRDAVLDEATNHYENKIKEIQADADKMKEQYFNLRHEHSLLKCKLEGRQSEFSHRMEKLKVQHRTEIEQLQNKIESLEKGMSSPDDNTAMELKTTKHDNLELNAKLKGLLAECEELRAKNENLTLQLSSANRIHSKQLGDNLSNIRALESEKQKSVMQKEVLEKEFSNLQEQKRILNNDLQASRREILVLNSKLEECEHKCHMIATNLQVENDRLKNEHQSEKEIMIDEITRIKSELKDMAAELNHAHQVLMTKEQELQQNSVIVHQQLWKHSNELQEEKERFERKFQDFKNQKDQLILQLSHEIQALQQDLQSKLELEKELLMTKEKLKEVVKNTDTHAIEMLSKQNLEYEQQIQLLKERISHLQSSSNVYFEDKDRLLSEMLSRRKVEAHEGDREVLELKLSWEQQKHQFHQRIQDLESQLKEIKNSSTAEKEKMEQKIEQYSRHVNKLKDKLGCLKARKDELETLKETFEQSVPFEIHMQVKNKLTELHRRLEEYRLIVGTEPHFSGCTKPSTVVSEKLLTDIKNLQLRLPPSDELPQEYETLKYTREKQAEKAKKALHHRKRPLKTRNRDIPSKTISPTITSSSDLESENL